MTTARHADDLAALELALAELSGGEMVAALGFAPPTLWLRALLARSFVWASRPLGRAIARLDADVGAHGFPAAADAALQRFGAHWSIAARDRCASPPAHGPVLVVANHPGAYDALAVIAALGRTDVAVIAADRPFLRALPRIAQHLLWVPDARDGDAGQRARGARAAMRHLRRGGALLHFAAGEIEPDPAFVPPGGAPLGAWGEGTGVLVRAAARAGGRVVPAVISGVHSARAKRLWLSRLAERRGVTTVAPLVQVTVPGYRRVDVEVAFGAPLDATALGASAPDDAALTASVRAAALALLAPR